MTGRPARGPLADRRSLLLVVGLVVLLAVVYVSAYALAGDRVPRGTTVAGIDVGGLRPAAAERTLRDQLGPRADRPMLVTAGDQRLRLEPAQAGLTVDYEETVARAGGGRSWSPARIWQYFAGGEDLQPVLSVEDQRLDAALDELASEVEVAPRDGDVVFRRGEARARVPRPGQELDRDAARESVTEAFLARPPVEVDLPVVDSPPQVSREEVQRVMAEFAEPAMSAPVTLSLGGEEVTVRPAAYGRALSVAPEGSSLSPQVDRPRLLRVVRPALREVTQRPRPATVRLVSGRPQVVPHENGVTFDPEQVTDGFLDVVVAPEGERTLELETVVNRPAFRTRDARQLGIREVVSSFTTYYPHADYRNTNLGRAAQLVNGTVLRPGETFSLNDTVGERTAANGFAEGFIISDGVFREDFGGGVSQVATTLFNAAFFAGLEDVEHKPHSFYIDRYPVGREATVAWGSVDLKFRNDTPHGVLIQAWIVPSTPSTSGQMHARMWSTKHWDITAGMSDRYNFTQPDTRYLDDDECVPNQGYGGFDIDVYRVFRRPGSDAVVRRETMHTTYTPSDTVICGPQPGA